MGRLARLVLRESARRGDPARVPSHHFQDEDAGRGARHRGDVVARLADARRHVLGDRPEARATVGQREIVVHGLGNADADERIAQQLRDLRHLVGGVRGIVSAVVEEVTDVVRPEHLDQPLVLGAALLGALQLVAARSERPARRVAQRADRRSRLLRGVDEILGQRADDAVAPGVELPDPALVLARGLDDGAGGGVDRRGYAAGLGVEGVLLCHG